MPNPTGAALKVEDRDSWLPSDASETEVFGQGTGGKGFCERCEVLNEFSARVGFLHPETPPGGVIMGIEGKSDAEEPGGRLDGRMVFSEEGCGSV
jgi:hypothetical protein